MIRQYVYNPLNLIKYLGGGKLCVPTGNEIFINELDFTGALTVGVLQESMNDIYNSWKVIFAVAGAAMVIGYEIHTSSLNF